MSLSAWDSWGWLVVQIAIPCLVLFAWALWQEMAHMTRLRQLRQRASLLDKKQPHALLFCMSCARYVGPIQLCRCVRSPEADGPEGPSVF